MFRSAPVLAAMILIAADSGAEIRADQWTQFRGPRMDGVVETAFPETWDAETNVLWKVPIEGEGWSCPVVWDDRLYLTAAIPQSSSSGEQDRNQNRRQRRGGNYNVQAGNYRWEVMCLKAETGGIMWRQAVRQGRPPLPRHRDNTFATETPITDGERVYAYFGMTGLYCLDRDGNSIWKKDLGAYEMRAGWGTSSSPVLFDGKLFLQIDNEQQSFLVAIAAETGDEIWRVNRSEPSQYSSPIIWQNSLRSELIVGGQTYRSYDPASGKVLWELDMNKGRSSATPLAIGDRLYVGTEFRNRGGADDGGGFLFAVKPGGSGDITPAAGASATEFIAWKNAESGIQMASPLLVDGHLLLLERRSGILHCINAESGEKVFRRRVSGARAFWASPWSSQGNAFCLDASGTTHVLAGAPDFKLVRTNSIPEQAWSTPAAANGKLYLRTVDHLYCIGSK